MRNRSGGSPFLSLGAGTLPPGAGAVSSRGLRKRAGNDESRNTEKTADAPREQLIAIALATTTAGYLRLANLLACASSSHDGLMLDALVLVATLRDGTVSELVLAAP